MQNNFEIKPSGIYNPSNYCYLNSLLQCLKHIKPIIQFFNKNISFDNILYSIINFFNLNITNKEETETIITLLEKVIDELYTKNEVNNIHNKFLKNITVDIKPLLNNINLINEYLENSNCLDDEEFTDNDIENEKIKKEYKKLFENKDFIDNIIKIKIVYIITSGNINKDRLVWFLKKIKKNRMAILLYDNLKSFIIDLSQPNKTLVPDKMIHTINMFVQNSDFAHLSDGNQQDIHELLQLIVYGLHESHSDTIEINIPQTTINMSDEDIDKLEINERIKTKLNKTIYNTYKDNFTSIIMDMHFYNLKLIQCRSCNHKSINFDDASCILTEIPNNNDNNITLTIYDCLESHFSIEPLDGFKCDNCGAQNSVMLNKLLTKPETLVIGFKRFVFNPMVGGSSKIYNNITYPAILNVSKYCPISSNEGNMYKLKCVLNHIGNVHGGHYYTYCYSDQLNNWYNLNDMNVNKIDVDQVLHNQNAYMLFYEKI